MNNSIPQNTQDDKQIFSSIQYFLKRFHVSSALKAANAYKKTGFSVLTIFQYLFTLVFTHRSLYMDFLTGGSGQSSAKDTLYWLMQATHINWLRFTTILSVRIIQQAVEPLTDANKRNKKRRGITYKNNAQDNLTQIKDNLLLKVK